MQVDREKATLLGVSVNDVYNAIQAQFGSLTVSQYNQYSRTWWVILQSDPKHRQAPVDLGRLYTRSNQGDMVPLSALVTTRWVTGPDLLPHFNGFPAAKINGNAAPGYSSGQAISAMEAVAREVLPSGYTYAWSGLAYEEIKSGGTSMVAFVFGLHHRFSCACRTIRILDPPRIRDDGSALRGPGSTHRGLAQGP